MGIKSANKLREALQKAKGLGIVEERFSIDDLEIVVRNLRQDEYASVFADAQDLEEIDYMNAFQRGHVSRAIVELGGEDLRDVDYVDDVEPDPRRPDQVRAVKLPRHKWLEENVLSSWGREALVTAYRKVTDATEKAEQRAKDGVSFLVPEETSEEKFRRIIGELSEVMGEVPQGIVAQVLKDVGLMSITTAEEVKQAMEAADRVARAKIEAAKAGAQDPLPVAPGLTPEEMMRHRVPLNQEAVEVTQPPTQVRASVPVTRYEPGPTPQAVPAEALQGAGGVVSARSLKQAALEMEADSAGILHAPDFEVPSHFKASVIESKLEPVDPKMAATIIDQRPAVPMNPRFKPRPR